MAKPQTRYEFPAGVTARDIVALVSQGRLLPSTKLLANGREFVSLLVDPLPPKEVIEPARHDFPDGMTVLDVVTLYERGRLPSFAKLEFDIRHAPGCHLGGTVVELHVGPVAGGGMEVVGYCDRTGDPDDGGDHYP